MIRIEQVFYSNNVILTICACVLCSLSYTGADPWGFQLSKDPPKALGGGGGGLRPPATYKNVIIG